MLAVRSFVEFSEPSTMGALASRFGSASWWAWFRETETINDESPHIRLARGPLRIDGVGPEAAERIAEAAARVLDVLGVGPEAVERVAEAAVRIPEISRAGPETGA